MGDLVTEKIESLIDPLLTPGRNTFAVNVVAPQTMTAGKTLLANMRHQRSAFPQD